MVYNLYYKTLGNTMDVVKSVANDYSLYFDLTINDKVVDLIY